MAKLVVLSEGFTGRTCELKDDRTTIGRLEDNVFQIAEPSVSSHHCEILRRGAEVVVKDLNSTNGTFIDGDPVTEAVLKPGQVLRLGQVEIRMENGATAAPSKKRLDHTAAIPQGVKLNDLESGTQVIKRVDDSVFKKKSNQVNRLFIVGLVLLGVILVAVMIFVFLKTPGNAP